jgi:hypothetical protein
VFSFSFDFRNLKKFLSDSFGGILTIERCSVQAPCIYLVSLASNFIPLWCDKIQEVISVVLNLLRLVLWPKM